MEVIDDIPIALKESNKNLSYESDQITFREMEIELRRNKFVFKRLGYSNIQDFKVYKGHLLKNRSIIIIGGLALIYLGISLLYLTYSVNQSANNWSLAIFLNRGSIFSFAGPIVFIGIGLSGIYTSFKKAIVVQIRTKTKTYSPRINLKIHSVTCEQVEHFLSKKIDL